LFVATYLPTIGLLCPWPSCRRSSPWSSGQVVGFCLGLDI